MKQEVINHIELRITELRDFWMKAAERIENIKVGEKIPATTMAEELASERGSTSSRVYPWLKMLTEDYPGVVVRAGRFGGIYRPALDKSPTQTDDVSTQNTDPNATPSVSDVSPSNKIDSNV